MAFLSTSAVKQLISPTALQGAREEHGKYYFVHVPENIRPVVDASPTDKTRWATLRKYCYEFMKAEVPQRQDALLLDVGIGPAQFRELYEHLRVVGVDLYDYPEAQVVSDLTQPLPFKNECFDVVFASNILEHLYRPQEAIREYARVLKSGGKLIGAVPFFIGVHQSPYDFFRYTHFALEQMLHEAGFQSVRVVPLGIPLEGEIRKQSGLLRYPLVFLKKVVWVVQKVFNMLLSRLLHVAPTNPDFALGYGFVGVKK
jgi:SAM-dependent methyltransferase